MLNDSIIMNRGRAELWGLVIFALLALFFIVPAFQAARAEVRDDLRRQDITNLKRALEGYNNIYTHYVTPPKAAAACTTSSADSWFFGERSPLLKEQVLDVIPHDVREQAGLVYTYCVTQWDENGQAGGYYLQATLEQDALDMVGFDEDELRKFSYRIMHEAGRVQYRVCGGNEKQCEK